MSALFDRRIGRLPFWAVALVNFFAVDALKQHFPVLYQPEGWGSMISPLMFLPSFIVAVWRMHDIGRGAGIVGLAFATSLTAGFVVPWGSALWMQHDYMARYASFFTPANVIMMALNLITFRVLALATRPSAGGWAPREAVETDLEDAPPAPEPIRMKTIAAAPVPQSAPRAHALTTATAARKSFGRRD